MKRIGIFGGSFNPIHLGHTALAASICEQGLVDEVWMMVSPQNPLKQNLELLDENMRLEMVRLAVADYPMLQACDFEFHLPRPSYTYHTLEALRKAYPDHAFSLIVGEDNWQHFNRWYRGDDILRDTTLIVYPRSEQATSDDARHRQGLKSIRKAEVRTHDFELPLLPYSSTEVRDAVARGKDISAMVHPDVAAYIRDRGVYGGGSKNCK